MKWSWFGRAAMALTSAVALGLGMTACGGGTIAYLWAVGNSATQSNGSAVGQVVGFRVDDFTGNLTSIPNQPFSANGTVPVDILVKPGGRFVYVIDQGTGFTDATITVDPATNKPVVNPGDAGTSSNVAVFSVGGTGSLTFEQSNPTQGTGHVWAQFDSTGNYLFVLDKYSPSGSGNGAITTFTVDPNTGRLFLLNQNASTQPNQAAPTYVEVGKNPLRMFAAGSCLFTVNSGDQTISTYSTASGQLGTVTTGTFTPGTINITSINGNSQYIFLTDNQNNTNTPGYVYPFTVGTNCALTPFTGGRVQLNGTTADPTNTFLTASGQFLYVMNNFSTSTSVTTKTSSVSGYSIAAGTLTELRNSPFSTGSGPVCMVEDPLAKYLYVADGNNGAITGYLYDNSAGQLSNLQRGSQFTTANANLSCLVLSGNV